MLNMAILAKQCWRIIKNLETMWVRVMKMLYFSKEFNLRCKEGCKHIRREGFSKGKYGVVDYEWGRSKYMEG